MFEKLIETPTVADWLSSQLGPLCAPDLLLNLFADCESIAQLCVLQVVRVRLGEFRGLHGESKSRLF